MAANGPNNPSHRPSIHGHVSPKAHDGWHAYCEQTGITVSALLQAIGEAMYDDVDGTTVLTIKTTRMSGPDMINHARAIFGKNRRRGVRTYYQLMHDQETYKVDQ